MAHPAEINPALTEDRLQVLTRTIVHVRADALEGHEPEKGDDAWTFGCRAYRRTCFAFDRLATTNEHEWLKTHTDGLAFTLLIGGEPIKFYRGDSANPTSRTIQGGLDQAIRQGRLQFLDDELGAGLEGWFWLLAIETHPDGTVMNVVVLQANREGETRNIYYVPLDQAVPIASNVTSTEREGVDLPPPQVAPKIDPLRKAGGDDGSQSG